MKRLGAPQGVPDAVTDKGFQGFQNFGPAESIRLFQTEAPVAHPGYDREPPPKPKLLLDLLNPHTAAQARVQFDAERSKMGL